MALQGLLAVQQGLVDATTVAVDKSPIPAHGPVWPRHQGRVCPRPAGTDPQAGWGDSDHHGWVYGYSFETVVSASKDSLVLPLIASAGAANVSEHRSFGEKIGQLPTQTRYVLADAGYDNNAHGEAIEYDSDGSPTGRRFVCPLQAGIGTVDGVSVCVSSVDGVWRFSRVVAASDCSSDAGGRSNRSMSGSRVASICVIASGIAAWPTTRRKCWLRSWPTNCSFVTTIVVGARMARFNGFSMACNCRTASSGNQWHPSSVDV